MATKYDATVQKFTIVDTGAVERDISVFIEDFDGDFSAKLHDDTAPGSTGDQFFRGIETGGITMTIKWARGTAPDPDATFGGLANHSAAVAFEYFPAGETAGLPKYSGNCWVAEGGWHILGRVGDMMKARLQLVFDNGWVRGTV